QAEEELNALLGERDGPPHLFPLGVPRDGVARRRRRDGLTANHLAIEAKGEGRIFREAFRLLERDLSVREHGAVAQLDDLAPQALGPRPRALEQALGELRHHAGVAVVRLHELLDAEDDAVDEAERDADLLLIGEGEPILSPPGAEVEEVADAPEH